MVGKDVLIMLSVRYDGLSEAMFVVYSDLACKLAMQFGRGSEDRCGAESAVGLDSETTADSIKDMKPTFE